MSKCLDSHTWLVAEVDGNPGGYAYATEFRARPAYRYSVETTIYLDKKHRNKGIGRRLYEALFEELSQSGFCQAFAGIALPNDASIALHRSVGFEHVGTLNSVGFKFDKWHDVSWWQRAI
jgi:phosphinothricin acetyltransferase